MIRAAALLLMVAALAGGCGDPVDDRPVTARDIRRVEVAVRQVGERVASGYADGYDAGFRSGRLLGIAEASGRTVVHWGFSDSNATRYAQFDTVGRFGFER